MHFSFENINTGLPSLLLKKYLADFHLDNGLFEKLAGCGRSRILQKSEHLVLTGPACPLYLVLSGKLKLIDHAGADEWILTDILRPGDFFGDITLSGNGNINRYAEVTSGHTLVWSFNVCTIKRIIKENPSFALVLAHSLGKKLLQAEKKNIGFYHNNTRKRVIDFFQKWAELEGTKSGNKVVLANDLTLTDLAGYVSASRQTIHSILKEFRKSEQLEWNRKKVTVCPSLWEKGS